MVALFRNEKSEGRKYANFEKVPKTLITSHFCFLNILLVSQKGLFTLQREPSDTPTRLISLAQKALFGGQNGSLWSVKRLSLQNKVNFSAFQNASFAHFVVFSFSRMKKIPA